MVKLKSVLRVAAALTLGLLPLACGDSKPVAQQVTVKEKLEEVGLMLKSLENDKQPPPGKAADLGNVEPLLPIAAEDLRSGEIVYFWGSTLSAGGKSVIAHEKKAPTDGGWVLLQDGTVKQLSAAEFQSAPKAGKK